jgi:hypothetical protein
MQEHLVYGARANREHWVWDVAAELSKREDKSAAPGTVLPFRMLTYADVSSRKLT